MRPKMYIGFRVKCPCYLPILIKLEFSRQIFEKNPKISSFVKMWSGSMIVACGQTD
jgi:hypothetical protein